MIQRDNYVLETRQAYRDQEKATQYHEQHTTGLTWARFTMRRECQGVAKMVKQCGLKSSGVILDIPCGAGVLSKSLAKMFSPIVAVDISQEMMDLAEYEFVSQNFWGYVQADITKMPFKPNIFDCIIVLGFMHRVPAMIRSETLKVLRKHTKRFVIISYSIHSPAQRMKRKLVNAVKTSHKFAPCALQMQDILEEFRLNGFIVKKKIAVAPLLSAEVLFLLEKI